MALVPVDDGALEFVNHYCQERIGIVADVEYTRMQQVGQSLWQCAECLKVTDEKGANFCPKCGRKVEHD